jgi:hypothetical protein
VSGCESKWPSPNIMAYWCVSEFLATDPEVSGSIRGPTRVSEK